MSLRCLFAASEVAGFAKTGGLADVAAALPRALAEQGVEVAVLMPLYAGVRRTGLPIEQTGLSFHLDIGPLTVKANICRSHLPGSSVPVYLIEQPELFERDDPKLGRGIYQFTQPDGRKTDYSDNSQRFGFFARSILEALPLLEFWPDVLHLNDWQTGLTPVYLKEIYRPRTPSPQRGKYARMRTVFTIHNLAYQGLFWEVDLKLLELPSRLFHWEALEFHGKISFLKAGLVFSDLLTTVSPTYAKEIQTAYFGCGLQGILLQRSAHLSGIVNGADYATWNPETDRLIARNYGIDTAGEGKAACKADLQRTFGIEERAEAPLLGIVSRLADQKGLDLVSAGAERFIERGAQLVVLGEGEGKYHRMLTDLRRRYPAQVGVALKQDEKMAHQVEAGADMFLMPSLYEPCGLNQLYSLKYGTVPVVRATGGLADTVVDATPENVAQGKATGFSFLPYAQAPFEEAVSRALETFTTQPATWRKIQETGMRQDWSWQRSARRYLELYEASMQDGD